MFGSKKAQVQTEVKPGPVFDPRTIPVHTMQDDLDILSGKVKAPVAAPSENKNTISGNDSLKSSPFMQNAAPISPIKTIPTPISVSLPVRSEGNQGISRSVNGVGNITKEPIKTSNFGRPMGILVGLPNASAKSLEEISKASDLGKIFVILAGVLIFLGVLGGGYYFYMTRYNTPELESEVAPEEIIPEIAPEKEPEVVVLEKFSVDNPNYLLLDVEMVTVADIQNLFIQKANEIKADNKNTPIEFVITDINNNPIALKIFARLMNVTFSSRLLDNFQDDFSVYVYLDGEKTRLGLSILPKDMARAMLDMKVEEKVLIKGMESLFLGEMTKSQAPVFQDAQYGDVAIRYLNLNEVGSPSVDYFSNNDQLVIATSKNTAWAIIDKKVEVSQE